MTDTQMDRILADMINRRNKEISKANTQKVVAAAKAKLARKKAQSAELNPAISGKTSVQMATIRGIKTDTADKVAALNNISASIAAYVGR